MTSLPLLVTDLRHAELCVLGGKFVVRPSQGSCLPEASTGLPRHHYILSITNSSHCCYHKDDPLIQSP